MGSKSVQDSLDDAILDWASWGRYSGPRQGEWCQTRQTKYDTAKNTDEAEAIRGDDVEFFDLTGKLVDTEIGNLAFISYAQVRWRWQKNGDNGEKRKYFRDPSAQRWCPCLALWNIMQRAKRLGIPANEPIAKYQREDGKILFITNNNFTKALYSAAKVKLGIKNAKELKKWSCHSLRVTAANELHRLGFNETYIKQRLRWRSDAFMVYLRDTIHIARKHSKAMRFSNANTKYGVSNFREALRTSEGDMDFLWDENLCAKAA